MTMVVPAVTPVPVMSCPGASVPLPMAVTVNTVVVMEPVTLAAAGTAMP